jgi:hypothetical protein
MTAASGSIHHPSKVRRSRPEKRNSMTTVRKPTCPVRCFRVTPEHFKIGVSQKSDACPVAEAFKDAFPQYRSVSVDLATIRATDPEKNLRYIWLTPPAGQAIITLADPDLAAASGHIGVKEIRPIWVTLKPAGSQVIPILRRKLSKAKLASAKAKEKATKLANAVKAAKAARKNPRVIIERGGENAPRVIGGKEPPMHTQHSITRRSGARRLASFDFDRLIAA